MTSCPTGTPPTVVASATVRSSLALPANRTVIGVRRSVSRKSVAVTPPRAPDSAAVTALIWIPRSAIRSRSMVTSTMSWVPA